MPIIACERIAIMLRREFLKTQGEIMSKILLPTMLIFLCCFVMAGCDDETQLFQIGDKVCFKEDETIGTVSFVEEFKDNAGNGHFLYHVNIHKEHLNGCIVYRKKADEMDKYIEDPR